MAVANDSMPGMIRYIMGDDNEFHAVSEWTLARDIQMNNGTFLTEYIHDMYNKTTTFNTAGTQVTETDTDSGEVDQTTFNDDGSITVITKNSDGVVVATKQIVFRPDGSILETFLRS